MDAIEELFVPVCVYNNKTGEDARTLTKFHEASWNNPVTRIVDVGDKDIVAANRNGWTVAAVARQITHALKKRGRVVPGYLALLKAESEGRRRGTETAVFGMT